MPQNTLPATINLDDPRLKNIKRVSKLMDEQFQVLGFKFGIDPLLNIIPVAGDVGGFLVSMALIITMVQNGASGKLVAKMVANAALDAIIGTIPLIGTVFDFAYKANTRNVQLLTQHYTQDMHQGSAAPIIKRLLWVVAFVMLLVLALIIYLSYQLLVWVAAALNMPLI